ncbi:MAG: DUF4012 domain-containing protein [Microthrixaceae bacterium]
MSTPRTRSVALGVVVLLLVAWVVACGVLLMSARDHAEAGLDAMDEFNSLAADDIPAFIDSIGDGATEDGLRAASAEFAAANDAAGSPLLAPMRILPMIGRQIRSVDSLSAAAALTTDAAADAVGSLSAILDRPAGEAGNRLTTTSEVERVLVVLQTRIEDLDLGPSDGLIASLADARSRFAEEYGSVLDTLDTAVVGVTGVTAFLEGPNRYVILAANNAEMRAGSGMFLQMGSMSIVDGEFDLGEFQATADVKLPEPGATVDPDVAAIWSPLEPAQDWRNLNLTPRFDESARMATEMWESAGWGPVDGAMAIDVVGLRNLLEVVGPVEIDGVDGPVTISADNIEDELLVLQYLGLEDQDPLSIERRAQLGRVAAAVFDTFNQGSLSATELLQVLQDSGAGRHLLLWSEDRDQQRAWRSLGASGEVDHDDMMLSILNRGGNKLDPYLRTTAQLSSTIEGDLRHVRLDVTIRNEADADLPRYVAGPYPGTDLQAGEYLGLLTLTVPGGAGDPVVTGAELRATGQDGETRTIVADVRIPRGQTLEVTIELDLPTDWTAVDVLASARLPATAWTAAGDTWTDDLPVTLELDDLVG